MTEVEIVKLLKSTYTTKNLNEADTRYKIIDIVVQDILHWPLENTFCEKITNGVRADYVLYGKNGKPVLVIESKKTGVYFDLPRNLNSNGNYQKITVSKLLSDKNIKNAILQVKEYCEDLSCSHACISNGLVWIFFNINSIFSPWKQQAALVVRDLDFFSEDYTYAYNILGYTNIVEQNSLKQNIGLSRQLQSEIFYPKNSITSYDTPVSSNFYAAIFNSLSRKYLGNIPFDNPGFISSCYVSNKGQFDSLQKNVNGFIYDSLTPYFVKQGARDFTDDRKGGLFAIKIEETIRKENLDNVMILFGGRGSGKSTFIKRLLFHLKPKELQHSVISVVDLLSSSQIGDELTREIWSNVKKEIDKDKLLEKSKPELLELFSEKFKLYEKQILLGLNPDSGEYHRLLNTFIEAQLVDTKYCCQVISRYWKSKGKGLIIVLDNMDQLRQELQDICFLNSIEIAKKLNCLVIISMREERYYNAKTKGVLDAYNNIPGFHLTSPVIPEVVEKRLRYILGNLKNKPIQDEVGIKNDKQLETIQKFLGICLREIIRVNSDLSKFLRFSTHGDVRQALDFFANFLSSGYTNVNEMAENVSWRFRNHQVVKPMMIPDRLFYDEKNSRMPNIYQLRNDIHSSHFTGLRLLEMLNKRSNDKPSAGFIDVGYVLQKFDTEYDLKKDCEKYLDIFLNKGMIEANNRLEEFSNAVDQVKITSFGKYMIESLAMDFTYLDLVCLDCGLFDETLNNFMVKAAEHEVELRQQGRFYDRILSRIERVEKFIAYLIDAENKEFIDLGISKSETKFSKRMKEQFDAEKAIIIKSAKHNEANNRPIAG